MHKIVLCLVFELYAVELLTPGSVVLLRNANVYMYKSKMRVKIDSFGKIIPSSTEIDVQVVCVRLSLLA